MSSSSKSSDTLKIAVTSQSAIKLQAVQDAFDQSAVGQPFEIRGFSMNNERMTQIPQPLNETGFELACHRIKQLDNVRTDYDLIADLNISLINWIVRQMNVSTKTIRSSQLYNCQRESGAEKLHCILHESSATKYISGKGSGSKRYIDEDAFSSTGIELVWQEFRHPVYKQLHGAFIENLSIVDLLFNEGFDNARNILLSASE